MLTTLLAYLLGGVCGYMVARAGGRVLAAWPVAVRAQVLVVATVIGLLAAWRLSEPDDLVGPLLVEAAGLVTLGVALATRGRTSPGQASLEAWAAGANGGFWVTPLAGAFGGPSAVALAALADRAAALRSAFSVHLLRRDAPNPQRRATGFVDQAPLLALLVGFALHLVAPAPAWSGAVLTAAGPVLAFTGALLFVGSVAHPLHRAVERTSAGWRRWLGLVGVRALVLLPVAFLARDTPLMVVAILSALGAPAFNPPQLALLYGYRSAVVSAAARWGWVLAPVGLVLLMVVKSL